MGGKQFVRVIEVLAIGALVGGAGACGGGQTSPLIDGGGGSGGPGPIVKQRPAPAAPLFDDTRVHEISLTMDPADWQSIIDDSRGDEQRHATVTFDGVVVDEVGIRPSGESSRFAGNQKMSFRMKFDAFDGQGFFGGYRDVNVKGEYDDGSMMRERLALFVFGQLMPTPKSAHARVMVNGNLRGLFTLREDWDEISIAEHFTQPVGALYRIRPLLPTDDPYKFVDTNPATYVPIPWESHIGAKNASRGDDVVPTFLQGLADTTQWETVVDADDMMAYLAGAAITMTTDGLVGGHGAADHFQYFDPASGKFFVLPWDPDNTFGSQGEMPTKRLDSKLEYNSLTNVVLLRSDLHDRYKQRITDAMAAIPAATIQARADAMYAQIKDAAHEDPNKIFPNDQFDWSLTDVKDFTAARYASLQQQLGN